MPSYVTSRHLSFADICSLAAARIQDKAENSVSPVYLKSLASQACVEFAANSECARGEQSRVLVASQREYRLPADCLKPLQVSINHPDDTSWKALDYREHRDFHDDWSMSYVGYPTGNWYLTPDRQLIGIHPASENGGLEATTSGAGNAGGTTIVMNVTAASATDDFYNDMVIRILDGALEGEEQTISDYVGSTKTATVGTAFSAQVGSGVRFEIGPDTLKIQYVRQGNHYEILPTIATVQTSPTPTYNTFGLNLPDRPPNYWSGCEVWFTAGSLLNRRSRILTATSVSASLTTVTVFPELPIKPTVTTDTVTVTDVPNIPDRYHHYLVEYIVEKVSHDKREVAKALARWENGIMDARRYNDPPEGETFERVREYRYGDG